MARTVNKQAYAGKRTQILDVALRLVYTKGYEQMAIQDILDELAISKGAFYHYFDSKPALLDALIERMQQEAIQLLEPIVQEAHLPALEKLQRFFDTAAQWKSAHRALMVELTHVWYADHNAIVRQKWLAMQSKNTLPLITHIFRQGMQEDVFHIAFPDQIGSIFLWIMQGFGDAVAELMLVDESHGDELQRAEGLVAAYNDAVERLLGAPAGSVKLIDAVALREWFVAPSVDSYGAV